MKICYINLLVTRSLFKNMEDFMFENNIDENFMFNHKNIIEDIDDEYCHFEISQSIDILQTEEFINLINFLDSVDEDLFRLVVKEGSHTLEDNGQLDMEEILGMTTYDDSKDEYNIDEKELVYNLEIIMKF